MKQSVYVVKYDNLVDDEVTLHVVIEDTVNRPNNPSDDELIDDFMYVNYGAQEGDFEVEEIEPKDIVYIGENYQVEV